MPDLIDIMLGGLLLSLRVWPAADPARTPVVLLPATGRTAEDWDVIAAELAVDRTVYAVDLRGHGDSDWPGEYRLELFAQDVLGLLDRLDTGPVDLVGHSLGGLVACRAAAAGTRRIRRLVLEDIGFPHPRPPAPPQRPAGELPFDWRVVEQVRPEVDEPGRDWAGIIARITVPTLLIGGGPSSPVPQQHIAELAARLADARLVTISAGHLIHETAPTAYLNTLTTFLTP
ncbi:MULTISPECIES: alpha/beta fold hydrolase [Micromonospora]|uniref:Alpha/beta hydrolase n=1 Tax=Micromonospora gifhornensis TaxID=84594 RepID=A0ABQ4IDR4_9ACTN|nr:MULTISPECIES: alpha/beta hydrolase [Micromonospora]PMR62377.1 alpha/beta hydrolase [Verrucosispora sp. ts21]GIJ16031.1 alpha/beta hydrolase [Micromonospora gifhornensis]